MNNSSINDDSLLLHINDIHLSYESQDSLGKKNPPEQIKILQGVNLKMQTGSRLSLMGPSGSGKTSLMMLITALEQATAGSIHILGQDITAMNESKSSFFRRNHVGIVFQDFHLIPTMTALDNVTLPLEIRDQDDAEDCAKEALISVGLEHRMNHLPGLLSGGEQQRVALARVFALKPQLILADEPTGNLDSETAEMITATMFALSDKNNCGIILITHDPNLAQKCDRTITINSGKLFENGALITASGNT